MIRVAINADLTAIVFDPKTRKVFKGRRFLFLLSCFFLSSLTLIGCRTKTQDHPDPSSIVAAFGDEVITMEDLKSAFRESGDGTDFPESGEEARSLRESVLDQLILERLFLAEAARLKLEISEEELNNTITHLTNGYSAHELRTMMREKNIDLSTWRERVSQELLIRKLLESVVNRPIEVETQEINGYYQAHLEEFRVEGTVHARQIVLETRTEAEEVHRLVEGGQDFIEAANQFSISPDSEKGGDLGRFQVQTMPEEFEIIQSLSPGEISPIIQTPYGFHIFKLEERIPGRVLKYEEVTEKIQEILVREKKSGVLTAWMEKLKKQAKIKINYAILNSGSSPWPKVGEG